MFNFKSKFNRISLLILIIASCLFGGIFGSWIFLFLNRYYDYTSQNNLQIRQPNQNIIIQEPKKVVVEQDNKIIETINTSRQVISKIYKISPTAEQIGYDISNPQYIALNLTSDGWLLANNLDEALKENWIKNYIVVTADKKVYLIDNLIPDDLTGFIFIHLANAVNLPVRKFVQINELSIGQLLIVPEKTNKSYVAFLTEIIKPTISSSERPLINLIIKPSDFNPNNSLAVFNLSGDIVALFDHNKKIVSATYVNNILGQLLVNKKIKHSRLGVNYLVLDKIVGAKEENTGVLLTPNQKKPAIIIGSPADKFGLLEKDRIVAADGVKIDYQNDLADIVSRSRPGQLIDFSIWRSEKQINIKVKLDELLSLEE